MGIGKAALKTVKFMFRNPARQGAKMYEQLPMGLSFAYTGYSLYDTMNSLKEGDIKKERESMLNTYAGMAAVFGSIFGVGGAVLFGGGIKLLGEEAMKNQA